MTPVALQSDLVPPSIQALVDKVAFFLDEKMVPVPIDGTPAVRPEVVHSPLPETDDESAAFTRRMATELQCLRTRRAIEAEKIGLFNDRLKAAGLLAIMRSRGIDAGYDLHSYMEREGDTDTLGKDYVAPSHT